MRVPVAGLTASRTIRAIYSDERYLPPGAIGLLDVIRSWPWARDAGAAPHEGGEPDQAVPAKHTPRRVPGVIRPAGTSNLAAPRPYDSVLR